MGRIGTIDEEGGFVPDDSVDQEMKQGNPVLLRSMEDIVGDGSTIRGVVSGSKYSAYIFIEPPFGLLPEEKILELDEQYLIRLHQHAYAFACLDGNAFGLPGDLHTSQYLPEAYANLWNNNALDDIPNLYPCTAAEAHYASLTEDDFRMSFYQSHQDFIAMGEERRAEIRKLFVQH